MKKINFHKNKGIVFWITGLPGSGKTTIAKLIHKRLERKFGPTVEISGDNLRKIFKFTNYDIKNRNSYAKKYSIFCNLIASKKINIIFSTVSLFHDVHSWNKKNITNYSEIFIQSNVKDIIKLNKKKVYKYKKNIMGVSLKPEFPKKPNIKIINNFNLTTKKLADQLFEEILKKYK
jgi:adenylylsulfate kinase